MPLMKLDGFRMILPVPEEWLTEIGRVAVYWSQLEQFADLVLLSFVNHPSAEAAKAAFGYKGHLGIAFKRRMRLWRMVATDVLGVEHPQFGELSKLIDRLSAYRGTRDAYVHGVWSLNRYDLDKVSVQRLGKGSHPVVPVTVKQLRDFCREMSDLIIEIIHLKAELGISPKAEEDHLGGSHVTVHPFYWP